MGRAPLAEVDARRFLLVAAHLLGIYLAVPLRGPGGVEFPVATTLVTVPALLLANFHRVRSHQLLPAVALCVIAAMSVLLAPSPLSYFGVRARGLVIWIWSIVAAYVLMVEIFSWKREDVARLFGSFAAAILVGAVLENYAGLRVVSDYFRAAAFVSAQDQSVVRDLEMVGFIRPRLFTSEPSDVAKFFTLSAFGWIALSACRARHLVGAVALGAGLWLIGSPIVLAGAGLQAMLLVTGQRLCSVDLPLSRPVKRLGFLLVAVAGFAFASWLLLTRVQSLASGADASTVIRIAAPIVVTAITLRQSPLWGAGVSGTESIETAIVDAYSALGLTTFLESAELGGFQIANQISNAFWLHWINFGLFGGSLVLVILAWWMRELGVRRRWFAAFAIFLFAQTMGAAHGPYFWTFVALILVTVRNLDQFGAAWVTSHAREVGARPRTR